jgi:uncharacterized protein YcnI
MTTRSGRPIRLVLVAASASVMLAMMLATPAWAHVTVHPSTLPAGSSDIELTFRVPNERDDADTVGLQVYFPTNLPLLTVDVLPVSGWTAKVDTRTLATPVRTDDGTVSQVVSVVTWTATAGGIAPGQYEDFDIAAGQGPSRPGPVIFKSLQTYSSGEVVRWIQVASPDDPVPDTPAPVLTITPAAASVAPASGSDTSTPSGSTNTAEVLAVIALIIAVVALAVVLLPKVRKAPAAGVVTGPDDHDRPTDPR